MREPEAVPQFVRGQRKSPGVGAEDVEYNVWTVCIQCTTANAGASISHATGQYTLLHRHATGYRNSSPLDERSFDAVVEPLQWVCRPAFSVNGRALQSMTCLAGPIHKLP